MHPPRLASAPLAAALLALGWLHADATTQEPLLHRVARDGVLGTSSELVVRAADERVVDRVEAAVFDEVARLDAVLSTWDERSELARIVQAGGGDASPDLRAVLATAAGWRARSGGAYEPGVAALTELWRQADRADRAPDEAQLRAAVAALAEPAYDVDGAHVVARRPFSLDAIAKGFVVDRAFEAGVRAAGDDADVLSFQIGGDTRVGDEARLVGVVDPLHPADNQAPRAVLELRGRAIASSGGYERGFAVGDAVHSHVLDPRTGRPCDGVLGASVVAPDVATADVLATLMCVLGPTDGFALLADVDGAAALVVTADGAAHASPGWADLVTGDARARPAARPWPEAFGLDVHFELAGPSTDAADASASRRGGRRRGGWKRPYVAVWIEDLTGAPAKTLCLWLENRRWLRDLRRWSRQHRDLPHVLDAMSRATRRPGSYSVHWDGTDDDGRALPPGRYTVLIEVVREHGSYQLIRRDVVLGGDAVRVTLPTNPEVAGASLRFGPAAGRSPR